VSYYDAYREVRGGSWGYLAQRAYAAFRNSYNPSVRNLFLSLRPSRRWM
jgi:hypothetical protein